MNDLLTDKALAHDKLTIKEQKCDWTCKRFEQGGGT